jgi:hypothetical protein
VREADDEKGALVIPDADEPVSFETHVKPLFRELDRQSMQSHFDLWSHDDVSQNADAILARLQSATCRATVRGLQHRSTSSDAGQKAANRADRFQVDQVRARSRNPVAYPRLRAAHLARLRSYGTPQAVDDGEVLYRPGDATYDLIVTEDATVETVQPQTRDAPEESL